MRYKSLSFFNVYFFVLRERVCVHELGRGRKREGGRGGRERERERESQADSMLVMEPEAGLEPMNCEIMT